MLDNNALSNASDRQDGGLRRSDDRLECIHLKHPKIADRECRTRDIARTKTARTGPFEKFSSLESYLGDRSLVRIVNDGTDNAFVNSHRQGNVYFPVIANCVARPGRVDAWMLLQRASRQKDQPLVAAN